LNGDLIVNDELERMRITAVIVHFKLTIPLHARRVWKKPQETLVKIASIQAKI
jgi:hypothetical protein